MDSHHVVVDEGVRMHYVTAGPADAPPLVLLHGFPTDWRLWRRCIGPLAEHYRVIAPDLPGHGWSEHRQDLDHDGPFYLRCLVDFLDALGLGRVHLAGHDLGGLPGLMLAGRHPERVERLVVLDTITSPNLPWVLALALRMLRWRTVTRLMTTRVGFALLLWLFTTRRRATLRRLVPIFHPRWSGTSQRRERFRLAASLPPARLSPTLEDLEGITAPTLILWAEHDPIFPVSVAEKLQRRLPDAILRTVPHSGHFVPEEAPDQVVREILAFLDEATRTAA